MVSALYLLLLVVMVYLPPEVSVDPSGELHSIMVLTCVSTALLNPTSQAIVTDVPAVTVGVLG